MKVLGEAQGREDNVNSKLSNVPLSVGGRGEGNNLLYFYFITGDLYLTKGTLSVKLNILKIRSNPANYLREVHGHGEDREKLLPLQPQPGGRRGQPHRHGDLLTSDPPTLPPLQPPLQSAGRWDLRQRVDIGPDTERLINIANLSPVNPG